MKVSYVVAVVLVLGCGEAEPLGSPRPAATASVGAGGTGGESVVGGQGGVGGAAPCDPWDAGAPECCVYNQHCAEGALGPCLVDVQLCGGACVGRPNPVVLTACGDAGTCKDGVCVEPEPIGGAGGAGGGGVGGGQ